MQRMRMMVLGALVLAGAMALPPHPATAKAPSGGPAGANSCQWAHDGECDEPEIGTDLCDQGTDTADCAPIRAGGNDTCEHARDGVCDETFIGTGACADGTDRTDCRAGYPWWRVTNACASAFDGRCDDGRNGCTRRNDAADCLGRDLPDGIIPDFFGRDDRILAPLDEAPFNAIGQLELSGGGACSGTLVARDWVLTAAHCIMDTRGRLTLPATFHLAFDGRQGRDSVRSVDHVIPDRYAACLRRERGGCDGDDWALLRLSRPVRAAVQPIAIAEISAQDMAAAQAGRWRMLTSAGYPMDGGERMLAHRGCRVDRFAPKLTIVYHDCDTLSGDSGGPTMIEVDGRWQIVSVLSGSDYLDNGAILRTYGADVRAFGDAVRAAIATGARP